MIYKNTFFSQHEACNSGCPSRLFELHWNKQCLIIQKTEFLNEKPKKIDKLIVLQQSGYQCVECRVAQSGAIPKQKLFTSNFFDNFIKCWWLMASYFRFFLSKYSSSYEANVL